MNIDLLNKNLVDVIEKMSGDDMVLFIETHFGKDAFEELSFGEIVKEQTDLLRVAKNLKGKELFPEQIERAKNFFKDIEETNKLNKQI